MKLWLLQKAMQKNTAKTTSCSTVKQCARLLRKQIEKVENHEFVKTKIDPYSYFQVKKAETVISCFFVTVFVQLHITVCYKMDCEQVFGIVAKHDLSEQPKLRPDVHGLTRFLSTVSIQK